MGEPRNEDNWRYASCTPWPTSGPLQDGKWRRKPIMPRHIQPPMGIYVSRPGTIRRNEKDSIRYRRFFLRLSRRRLRDAIRQEPFAAIGYSYVPRGVGVARCRPQVARRLDARTIWPNYMRGRITLAECNYL